VNFRIGTGFDIHRLVVNRKLVIGGVDLDFSLGLLGHSDADVLLHAITDALLGAAGLGDIGHAFDSNNPDILGISSMKILRESFLRVKSLGYEISNIDTTILAEKPKMKNYLPEMVEKIAGVCEIAKNQVNIKATTTEKMGFIGRNEAIAAQAAVLITKLT